MGLFNFLFRIIAKKVADKEYGPGQTAYGPDKAPPPKDSSNGG